MPRYIVHGGKKLSGTVTVSGSKNAALPIMAASLLIKGKTVLRNVPDIGDIHTMVALINDLGAKASFAKNTVTIDASGLKKYELCGTKVRNMRASILLVAPLLARLGEAKMSFPGGCVLGKRPIDTHLFAFQRLKAKIAESEECIHIRAERLKGNFVVLPEMSVTATENTITAAVTAKGTTSIRLAAMEPHVQDLCNFLVRAGAKISGIGTHCLEIEGVDQLEPLEYTVCPDYLETGTLAIAAIITHGNVTLKQAAPDDLDIFWSMLRATGARFTIEGDSVTFEPHDRKFKAISQIKTAVYPGFPTDLQAPFAVLLTQCHGTSSIFETLFDGRLNYLFELEKMGANIDILNPHRANITGPARLKGCPITSCDIRAGASMVLASLIAEGETEISNLRYIDRGYENLEQKLRSLGAEISRRKS